MNTPLSLGQAATLACLWEVTIPKPGNVHCGADFDDVTFEDFVTSAVAIGPAMESATKNRVGRTVLTAVEATRAMVTTNTNLGTVLLLAPLAAVPRKSPIRDGVRAVLAELDADDAADVYQAIRTAQPGGLGKSLEMDVAGPPPQDLRAAMQAAADRDLVAKQYINGFETLFTFVVPQLTDQLDRSRDLAQAVIHTHVHLMAELPDSLIARKCGRQIAQQSATLAAAVLDAGPPGGEPYGRTLADLDFWLRSDGHRRNPGTTADLIAAGLFVLLSRESRFESQKDVDSE